MEDYRLEQSGQEVQNILNGAAMQVDLTAETERATEAEQTLDGKIDTEKGRIDALEEKIPSGASSSNKLATEEYVDDSVATATATFRGTFNLVSDLGLTVDATEQQIATALAGAISTADNNDYAFVQIPTSDETPTEIAEIDRYKYNGSAWAFEYALNNSGFTAAEWAAINSGITSELVTKLGNLPTAAALAEALASKQNVLTFDSVPTEGSNNPVKSDGVYSAIDDEKGARLNADAALQQAIEAILLLIPSAASSLNQLADKAFVNSSIATNTATFRGTFNLVNDLHLTLAATHAEIGTALASAISDEDNNDYCFVQIPTAVTSPTEIAQTDRYKFNGSTWEYEYTLNNSGFTSAQWTAINSGITSALVSKLSALPTNSELTTDLGTLTSAITAINQKIPSAAAQNNKLVDTAALESYIVQVLGVLTVSYNITSTDGHVTLAIQQTDGKITSVSLTTSDIASAAALNLKASQADLTALANRVTTAEGNITTLGGRVSTNETDIAQLQAAYEALTQSDIIIGALPASGVANKIYRVPGTSSYSDYMWNGTQFVLMATYNNAIDPRPKKGSTNLVESGGVFDNMGALDISELNATENPHTLATYADLSAALAAIPSNDYKKGGMSIKFVQTSDNNYHQYFLTKKTWSINIMDWVCEDIYPVAPYTLDVETNFEDWEQGQINNSGQNENAATRIRTKYSYIALAGSYISLNNTNYKYIVSRFNKDTGIYIGNSGWMTSGTYVITEDCLVRVFLAYADNSNIAPSDYNSSIFTVKFYSDLTGNTHFSGFTNVYVTNAGEEISNSNRITSEPIKCCKGDKIFLRNPIYQYSISYYNPDGNFITTTILSIQFRNTIATIEFDGFIRLGIYNTAELSPSSYSDDWVCINLTDYIDDIYIEPIWEQGGFTGGVPSDSTTRIRSQYMLATTGDTITPTNGVKCIVLMYSDTNYKYFIGESAWINTGNTYTIQNDCYIRILVGRNDNSAISPISINAYNLRCRITAKTKRYINDKNTDLKDCIASNAIANADVISKVEQVLTHVSAFTIDDMGMVYAAYYCNDNNVYEDYHDTTTYIDFFKFDLLEPQNRTQIATIKVGDSLGAYTITSRPPYDPNIFRFNNIVRLYFTTLNGTEYQLGYVDYDITTQTFDTNYHVCTLNGETFNVTQLLNVAESSIVVTDSLFITITGKIAYRDGYYYTAVGMGGDIGSLSDFNGVAIRSTDGINWSFYVKPPDYGLGGICVESSLEFSGNYMFWIERRNASGAGIYLFRYEMGLHVWKTDYLNMNGADSKPRLELYYDKLYAFYNAKDAEKDTDGLFILRADFIISEIDVYGFTAKEILKIKSKGGCQYPYVYNNKGFLYLMFSGNRRALRDPSHETTATGCRSNICLSDITYLI